MSRRDSRTDGSGAGSVPVVQVVGFHVEGAANSHAVNDIREPVRETPTVLIPPSLHNADQVSEAGPMRRSSSQATPTGANPGTVFQSTTGSGDGNSLSKTPSMSDAWKRMSSETARPSEQPTELEMEAALKRTLTPKASPRMSPASSQFLPADVVRDARDAFASTSSTPLPSLKPALSGTVSSTPSPIARSVHASPLPAPEAVGGRDDLTAVRRCTTMPTSPVGEAPPPLTTAISGPPMTSAGGGEAPPPAKEAGMPPKAKPTTKAERRALQEEQRAKKAAAAETGAAAASAKPAPKPVAIKMPPKSAPAVAEGKASGAERRSNGVATPRPVDMFSHLPAFKVMDVSKALAKQERIHAAVLQLGLAYADGSITGSTARTIAMMIALKTAVADFVTPDQKAFSRSATAYVNTCVTFLWEECRPGCVPQRNAVKWLKSALTKIPHDLPEAEAKAHISKAIDDFIHEKFVIADKVLSAAAVSKIEDGDVIMTYAYSSVVLNALCLAHQEGKHFEVICVDGRPHFEGEKMCRKLLGAGVACTYVHLNAISYAMKPVTKVLLGASAVKSNGAVVARAGTAVVAMAASAEHKPVLICAQSIKFHEDVQLDSLTSNEQGNPKAMLQVRDQPEVTRELADMKKDDKLTLLNLVYDVMPMSFVTLIVTEFGLIPPTSVPVILREKRDEELM